MRYSELVEAGEQPIYYFSYGMLTNPNLMRGAKFIGHAILQNYKFEFYKYADIVQGGRNVDGVLWQLPPDYIRELDRVENYPTMYGRKTVPVFTEDGKRYEAWVYYMTPAAREYFNKTDRIPTNSYIKSIIDGYRHAGIKPQQVSDAYYELI